LIVDRALAGPAQLVYLPNRGEFYEYKADKAAKLDLTPDHAIIQHREAKRAALARAEAEAKIARDRRIADRKAKMQAGDVPPVDHFNTAHSVADLLARYGYIQDGSSRDWQSPMQQSGSYATRDFGDYWVSLSGSDADAEIGAKTKDGNRHGDAFDLYCHFEHDGDSRAAVRAYAQEARLSSQATARQHSDSLDDFPEVQTTAVRPEISDAAQYIVKTIARRIKDSLPDLKDDPEIDGQIIQRMIDGAFWSGVKSKIFLLNHDENLVQFLGSDAWKFLCKRFGKPVEIDKIVAQVTAAIIEAQNAAPDAKLSKVDQAKIIKAAHAAVIDPILDHLKFENQRDQVEFTVDMFAKRAKLQLKEDVVRIVLTHKPLDESGTVDQAVIDDYRAHFPQIDQVLAFIIAARFALDRKKAYLWLFMQSDWGKGFLMGVLKDHGLVVEMSVREIEGIFEGKPAGRSPADFKRAMILAVDEFKAVKSELKQLQSEIYLAPKYQLTARVEIFTKLFLSAESVGSLVTENGVEDQFANRMSMITGAGTINQRPLYQADQGHYYRSVVSYIGKTLNRLIADYRNLDRKGAERRADGVLNAFIGEHGLDQHYARLSDSYPDVAMQAVEWVRNERDKFLTHAGGQYYLAHASKALDDFLTEHYTFSEVATLRRRKPEILEHMSADGRGNASHRLNGTSIKAVRLP
jgi:hypothetical protein